MPAQKEGNGDFAKAWRTTTQFDAKSAPNNNEQLELYALASVALEKNFAEAKAPSAFNLKDKYKYNAWKAKVEAGLSSKDAEKQYISKVRELKGKYTLASDASDEAKNF